MMILESDTQFDFQGKIKMAMVLSGLLIQSGMGSVALS
jgi:hypothetical protein